MMQENIVKIDEEEDEEEEPPKCGICTHFLIIKNVDECFRLGVCAITNQLAWNSNYCVVLDKLSLILYNKYFLKQKENSAIFKKK